MEKMTRPAQVDRLLSNHLPHTTIAVFLALLHGHFTMFMLLNIFTGVVKAIGLLCARVWSLRMRNEWSEMYKAAIRPLDVAAGVCKRVLGAKSPLSRRLERTIVNYMVKSGSDPHETKDRAMALYNLHTEVAGQMDWARLKSMQLYGEALLLVGGKDCWQEARSLNLQCWKFMKERF